MKTPYSRVPALSIALSVIALTPFANGQDSERTRVKISRSGLPESLSVSGTATRCTLRPVEGKESAWTGTLTLGAADYAVQVACPGADQRASITIGGDGAAVKSSPGSTRRGRTTWAVEKTVELDGTPYKVASLTQQKGRNGETVTMLSVFGSPLYGKVEVQGAVRHLALLDGDGDGKVHGAGDRWLLLTDAEVGAFNKSARGGKKRFNSSSMQRADHPVFLGAAKAVYLGEVGADSAEIKVTKPEHTLSHYLHQRAADINAGYGRDLSRYDEGRPAAEKPIAWTYALDLDPLLAKAKAEGKPLLVDFETDWCGWCHVLDLATYPDKEVAAFVNEHFIPVKWNCELDPHGTHSKYGVRGFPSMVVIGPDGTKIEQTVGFKKASEFVVELQKLHAAAKKAMGD